MKYTDITLPVTFERTGLLLRLTAGKYATTTLNLQDHFGWSDEQAQQAIALMDHPSMSVVEAACHEKPATTTININQLVDCGWVQYPEDDKAHGT